MPELNNNRGNNRRRGRGNNNRPQNGGQQLNRIDSRARGNAPQMLEKYRKLAQDAHLNGDRVQAEYYLQFADHYFRVIADTRVRQEEQRARPNGERWQEQETDDNGDDFSVEGDFPAFDRPSSTRHEREDRSESRQRDDRPQREDRARDERPREDRPRDDRQREDRGEPRQRDERPREAREDRPREDRNEGRRENRRFDRSRSREAEAEVAMEERLPGEGVPAIEGEPIAEVADNPFVRESRAGRGLRPRTERRPRRTAEDEAPATLDASFLPPSISTRSEPEPEAPAPAPVVAPETADEAPAPAPKKRGRPRKNPLPEATAPAEG
ncbi:DUF4167 domain-containing protein [Novosphingobium taihuense]|uniref:DUF4167 domain-containing protein n=1 Tax=Novosphingobium taihuense TaxID=260085 RepID=A0A7W7ACM5_9SPHN|nr:DUF4167 domain-containing protein [Novosphingobium taihuense]MBB4614406.1 hypothetical protein [Novosphingobium taihuense]